MQRVFRVVNTAELKPVGVKTTGKFNRSIRQYGVLNPVLLADVSDQDGVIGLTIIDGNRRVRAAKLSGLPKVPAVVLKATSARDRARLTLMCNYMRSGNFHTESMAIMALAGDEDAAAQAAGAIGLGSVKMQQLYRKIATMPHAIRTAMYDHRIPVTAASWVGSWPEELQQEVVALLERRRYVNSSALKDLKVSYDLRHPEAITPARPARDVVPDREWADAAPADDIELPGPPQVMTDPVGADVSATNAPISTVTRDVAAPSPDGPSTHPARQTVHTPSAPPNARELIESRPALPQHRVAPSSSAIPRASGESGVDVSAGRASLASIASEAQMRPDIQVRAEDDRLTTSAPQPVAEQSTTVSPRVQEGFAFVIRLDETLADLARQAHAHNLPRAAWVDRAMRAWDRAETS